MRKLFMAAAFVFPAFVCKAQGSWNIGYIEVDSITTAHIGRTVRIDFKTKDPWFSADGKRPIRSYVQPMDTGTLEIDKTPLILAERRTLYADHGSYGDQYLECINCGRDTLLVYDSRIISVDGQSIQFQLDIEIRRTGGAADRQQRTTSIARKDLDGVLYKRKEKNRD